MRSYRLEIGQGNIHVKAPSRQKAILQAAQVYSRAALDLQLGIFIPPMVRVREGRRTHKYPMARFLGLVLSLAAEDRQKPPAPPAPSKPSCPSCLNFDLLERRCMAPPAYITPRQCLFMSYHHLTPAAREALK